MAVEEIGTRKETTGAMIDVEEMITKKVETGIALNAIILILPSGKNVIAVKQIALEMVVLNLKENLTKEVKNLKRQEIGLVLSATILISPSEINAIAVMLVDLVQVASPHREVDPTKTEALGLKEVHLDEDEDERQGARVNHEDLDSEALVEVVLEAIDQEEVAVGAEFGSPQHSFCLILSKTYDEQGGYALGRCSRA